MMETITITLSRKMGIGRRVSEAGNRLRDWVRGLQVRFNDERDKLQLEKWELKNAQYHYHYLILRGKELSAGKVNIKQAEQRPAKSVPSDVARHVEAPPNPFPAGPDTLDHKDILTGD